MRDFAHHIVYSAIYSFFFGGGVLQIVYTQNACRDFDAKYVKSVPFWVAKPKLKPYTFFPPKSPFWGRDPF